MIRIHSDLKDLLRLLTAKQVRYLLVGGYAVAAHGHNRTTADFDLWVARDEKNADRLVDALEEFGAEAPNLSATMFTKENKIVRFGNPPLMVEIHTTLSGVTFESCWRDREKTVLDGVSVNLISFKKLLANKKASGRLKDLADLESLSQPRKNKRNRAGRKKRN